MARAMGWAMNREGDNYLVVNVGSNEWNYQVKELASLIQIHLPQTKIIINQIFLNKYFPLSFLMLFPFIQIN